MKKIVVFSGAVEGVNELINKLMVQTIGDDKNDK